MERADVTYPEGTRFQVHFDNGYLEGEFIEVTLHWITLHGTFGKIPVFYEGPSSGEDIGRQVNPDRILSLEKIPG
jgi:hypothetical protein